VSLILDALRRRPPTPGPPATPRRTPQTDAVLATLGYSRSRPRFSGSFTTRRVIPSVLAGLVLGLVAWGSYLWYTLTPPSPAHRAQALPVDRPPQPGTQTPPQEPNRPAAVPSTESAAATPPATTASTEAAPSPPGAAAPSSPSVEPPPPPAEVRNVPSGPLGLSKPVGSPARGPISATGVGSAPSSNEPLRGAGGLAIPDKASRDAGQAGPTSDPPRGGSGPAVQGRPPVSRPPPTAVVTNPESPPAAALPPPLAVRSSRVDAPATVAPPPPPLSPTSGAIRPPAGSVTARSQADHFRLALYYHQSGDFENALVHYRAVLLQNELNSEAHNNLGLLYQERGLIDEALKEFQRAIGIDQRYVKAHNNLGVVWLGLGKIDAAAAEFRAALAADPKNVESLTNLAVVIRQTGGPDEARGLLQRALRLEPRHAASHYNMALICEERGDLEGAIRHYRSFVDNSTPDQAVLAGEVRKRLTALTSKLGK